MIDPLFQLGGVEGIAGAVIFFLLYLVIGVLPACGASYLIYFFLTLPMRRNERARFFLDLLERGLKDGQTPEETIVQASATHDRTLGVRFHVLAAYLQEGMRLSEALERVPRLLPPQLKAMFTVAERTGDLAGVLAVCRRWVQDGISHVRSAHNYLILLAFAVTPFVIFVPLTLRLKVLPSYRAVFSNMLGGPLPAFTRFVFAGGPAVTLLQTAILLSIWVIALFYLGGPRLHGWVRRWLPGPADWLLLALPWRRKRLQRDFSTVLAMLLDAQVPELEAVQLAGESTANSFFVNRARAVCARLKEGVKLPEALGVFDDTGELHWRLANVLRSGGGFVRGLTGWHEALEVQAFQQEQTAAQLTTTGLVLLNGVMVASLVTAVFMALIRVLNEAVLW